MHGSSITTDPDRCQYLFSGLLLKQVCNGCIGRLKKLCRQLINDSIPFLRYYPVSHGLSRFSWTIPFLMDYPVSHGLSRFSGTLSRSMYSIPIHIHVHSIPFLGNSIPLPRDSIPFLKESTTIQGLHSVCKGIYHDPGTLSRFLGIYHDPGTIPFLRDYVTTQGIYPVSKGIYHDPGTLSRVSKGIYHDSGI